MDVPYPLATQNDVIVRVHAGGFTPGELDWSGTWTDRAGRDRTPSVPGHELSGIVAELGYGTTGLTVGQRVFGMTDWTRNGSLAEYAAVEARNLAPLPADIDHTVAAALPISGLTAWQGLFDHARLATGQTVLIHGAAGGVGSIAVRLAREVGARVIGTGRAADRDTVLGLGVDAFLDLPADTLADAGQVDVVFDVIGGQILDRSAALVRAGGTLVTTTRVPTVQPKGRARCLLRGRSRPFPAGGPCPAAQERAAQANHRGGTAASRSTRRLRPRPAHPWQDHHSDHRRRITSCGPDRLGPTLQAASPETATRRPLRATAKGGQLSQRERDHEVIGVTPAARS
jgi:NADPH:quinone reductase-like Zn-dependent oxidoreductase